LGLKTLLPLALAGLFFIFAGLPAELLYGINERTYRTVDYDVVSELGVCEIARSMEARNLIPHCTIVEVNSLKAGSCEVSVEVGLGFSEAELNGKQAFCEDAVRRFIRNAVAKTVQDSENKGGICRFLDIPRHRCDWRTVIEEYCTLADRYKKFFDRSDIDSLCEAPKFSVLGVVDGIDEVWIVNLRLLFLMLGLAFLSLPILGEFRREN